MNLLMLTVTFVCTILQLVLFKYSKYLLFIYLLLLFIYYYLIIM